MLKDNSLEHKIHVLWLMFVFCDVLFHDFLFRNALVGTGSLVLWLLPISVLICVFSLKNIYHFDDIFLGIHVKQS